MRKDDEIRPIRPKTCGIRFNDKDFKVMFCNETLPYWTDIQIRVPLSPCKCIVTRVGLRSEYHYAKPNDLFGIGR